MQTTGTKPEAAGTRTRVSAPVSLVTELTRQGVDSALATQRIMLDLVMRQNATTVNALRGIVSGTRPPKPDGFIEVAGEGLANFIAAQRVLLNTALRQNEIMMNGAKERMAGPRTGVIMDMLRRSVETFIDMQQHLLTIAERQTNSWMEQTKTGKTPDTKGLTDLFEDGMEQFVRSQKKLLDMIAEESGKAAEAAKQMETAPQAEPATDLTEILRQSAGSFIDMQKKLLDVAGKQVDVSVKAARRAMDFVTPSMRTSVADMMRQYVENVVAAQKSMLDVMMKPRPAMTRAEEAQEPQPKRRAARKPRKRRTAAQ